MFVCFHRSMLLWEAEGGRRRWDRVGARDEDGRKAEEKQKESLKPESVAFPLPDTNLHGGQSGRNYSGRLAIRHRLKSFRMKAPIYITCC